MSHRHRQEWYAPTARQAAKNLPGRRRVRLIPVSRASTLARTEKSQPRLRRRATKQSWRAGASSMEVLQNATQLRAEWKRKKRTVSARTAEPERDSSSAEF